MELSVFNWAVPQPLPVVVVCTMSGLGLLLAACRAGGVQLASLAVTGGALLSTAWYYWAVFVATRARHNDSAITRQLVRF